MNSLADMIFRLYSDRDLGIKLGKAARSKALKTFDVATHVTEVERVYSRLNVVPPTKT